MSPWININTTTSTTSNSALWFTVSSSGTAITGGTIGTIGVDWAEEIQQVLTHLERNRKYTLPDGGEIAVDNAGNWSVSKNGTVQYRAANIRNFNRFLNASDLLEAFIADCGALGVRQNEILRVPIHAFINWLIFKAAEADGEASPVPKLPASKPVIDRCLFCKRFLPLRLITAGVNFCNGLHLDRYRSRELCA